MGMTKKEAKSKAERSYREGIGMNVEATATSAEIMTGKKPKDLTNAQVRQANKEMDDMDYRETHRLGRDAGELGKKWKDSFKE
jgi:hypothetical protein